jgi:hypothetical protein
VCFVDKIKKPQRQNNAVQTAPNGGKSKAENGNFDIVEGTEPFRGTTDRFDFSIHIPSARRLSSGLNWLGIIQPIPFVPY